MKHAKMMPASPISQTSDWRGNAVTSTRRAITSAATFVAADMNVVTGVGAPSYASGVHMWKGAAFALKPRPTRTNAIPARSRTPCGSPSASAARIRSNSSWPDAA